MIESIGKLRELLKGCGCSDKCYSCGINYHGGIADEIEAEIAERYMLLPCDADGVPIRIGDTVREIIDCVPMKVMSLTFYEDCVDVNACGMNPKLLFHVNPRTIEDVLRDLVDGIGSVDFDALTAIGKAADEIRELMEVDR